MDRHYHWSPGWVGKYRKHEGDGVVGRKHGLIAAEWLDGYTLKVNTIPWGHAVIEVNQCVALRHMVRDVELHKEAPSHAAPPLNTGNFGEHSALQMRQRIKLDLEKVIRNL